MAHARTIFFLHVFEQYELPEANIAGHEWYLL